MVVKVKNNPFEKLPMENITTRDYFAVKAMQGLLSDNNYYRIDKIGLLKQAYEVADIMLKVRSL